MKKPFSYRKRFTKIKDFVKTPMEIIKEKISGITPKTIVMSGIFQILVLLIGFIYIVIGAAPFFTPSETLSSSSPSYSLEQWIGHEKIINDLTYMETISYLGSSNDIKHTFALYGPSNYTIRTSKNGVPSVIYFLEVPNQRYSSGMLSGKDLFKELLKVKLKNNGYTLISIGIEDMQRLKNDDVVVAPTGYFPVEFANNLKTTMIFIGSDIRGVDIDIEEKGAQSGIRSSKLNIYNARYLIRSPTKKTYGDVIDMFEYDEGKIVTVPGEFENGRNWNSIDDAVDDVVKIITESPWDEVYGNRYITEGVLGFGSEFSGDEAYFLIKNDEGKIISSGKGVSKNSLRVYTATKNIPPYGIHRSRDEIFIKPEKMFLSNEEVGRYRGEVYTAPPVESSPVKIASITTSEIVVENRREPFFGPGNYLLVISDGPVTAGKIGTIHGFTVVEPIISINPNPETNTHIITIACGDRCDVFDYDSVVVYIDEKQVGKFQNNEKTITLRDLKINPENHVLTLGFVRADGREYRVSKEFYVQSVGLDQYLNNPIYLVVGSILVIVVAAAIQLRRKDKIVYNLDIPDFPPLSRITVPLKKSTVISLFDKINKEYGWHYLPISSEEFQSALMRLSYRGRPISASINNIERILDLLCSEGYAKVYNEYYGLSRWEEELGISIKHLSILRKLRDLFINNVLRFEPFGTIKHSDTKIYISGNEYYVILFKNAKDTILNSIGPLSEENVIIIFESTYQKDEFLETLYSKDNEVLAFKLELNSHRIKTFTIEEFESFVKSEK